MSKHPRLSLPRRTRSFRYWLTIAKGTLPSCRNLTFRDLTIEEGGRGAGTTVRVHMEAFGIEQHYRMMVSEPEPGRVLVEHEAEAGVTTTFTVAPLDEGGSSLVTIATESRPSPGLRGVIERLQNPRLARRIYRQELKQLADYVQR